jgi:membrane protease YdiL (CAAX protease family)
MVEHAKERARGPGMSHRPSSFARGVPNWPDLWIFALAPAIGLFEAVFWRGWVLLRHVASFGIAAAVMLSSLLYVA